MRYDLLLTVIGYFVILSLVIGYLVRRSTKITSAEEYALAGRSLSAPLVFAAITLVPFGAGNSVALWEAVGVEGASVLWWMIVGSSLSLSVVLLGFGHLMRRLGMATFPELLSAIFDIRIRYIHAVTSGVIFIGITSMEMMATGAVIWAMTGLPYSPHSLILAAIVFSLYLLIGGTRQQAYMNMVNIFVIYIGLFVALMFLGQYLGQTGSSWATIGEHYSKLGESWKLSLIPLNRLGPLLLNLIIPILIVHTSAMCTSQGMYSPALGAKSTASLRRSWLPAVILNGLWGYSWVVFGLVAVSIPAFMEFGPVLNVLKMALSLPFPATLGILMALLAATISTGSALNLGGATGWAMDVYATVINPKASHRQVYLVTIVLFLICMLLSLGAALFLPVVLPAFLWAFSFAVPVFTVTLLGVFWKRNTSAALWTIICGYVVNFFWTFGVPLLPSLFASLPKWFTNVYPVTIVSIVLGVILTLSLPGTKDGFLKGLRDERVLVQAGKSQIIS